MAAGLALRLAAARMAPARLLETPSFLAILDWIFLNEPAMGYLLCYLGI